MTILLLFILRISGVGIFDFTMARALPTLLRTKEASGDNHRECLTIANLREALAAASLDD
ncbi:LysR family transcriptional regulator [Cupriavidus laharis]|uniref:LysR family transcriptional regulator n=1 Tax=Cupriavidus laharis TaxID=151654 RepID=UPI001CC68580|nr:LysR family transcriptional regulator [Cupriavidus laharis]